MELIKATKYGFILFCILNSLRRVSRQLYDSITHQSVNNTLRQIETKLNITQPSDWYKVPVKDVLQIPEGTSLLKEYNQSITDMLKSLYPNFQWEYSKYFCSSFSY